MVTGQRTLLHNRDLGPTASKEVITSLKILKIILILADAGLAPRWSIKISIRGE